MKSESSSSLPAVRMPGEGASVGSVARPATDALPRVSSPAAVEKEGAPLTRTFELALLRGAMEEIPFGVATLRGGLVAYANEALERIYGVPQGNLEGHPVGHLFPDEVYARILERLSDTRCFDGRVSLRTSDGRAIDAELHVEQYTSEVQGVGGFLVLRDVSLELGAIGRLVDQLGGALFRVRVSDTAVEAVSPAISKLTGVDAPTVLAHPVVLTALVSAEERERLLFLYRRLARGEMSVASAQISVRRSDGTVRLLHVRATGRRDGSGVVRHIEGVVNEADGANDATARASEGPPGHDGARPKGQATDPPPPRAADPIASATVALAHELLRESSQILHGLSRELRGLRGAVKGGAAHLPPEAALDLTTRVETAAEIVSGAAAINRGVRRVLATATTLGAPLSELLEKVQAVLMPVLGAGGHALFVDTGDAAHVIVPDHVEEVAAALVYLSLRAFRFAGSGSLHIAARRAAPPSAALAPPRLPGSRNRRRPSRTGQEQGCAVIEIAATAPPDLADQVVETSSDVLRAIPRPAEADAAYQAAVTVLGSIGGSVDSDDATFATARTLIRLRV